MALKPAVVKLFQYLMTYCFLFMLLINMPAKSVTAESVTVYEIGF